MDRDTLWFRRPPPRRSRVTHMNREEKVSPTYHHRRSTGAPILSPWGHCAGASARSPVWSARAGFDMQRECGLWTVGIACGRRCSPGSRGADVSRPAGRRNSDGRVKTPPCGMCAERVAHCAASVLGAREGSDGGVAELVQGPQSCPRWGAPLATRVAVGCSRRRAGSLRDALSEMRESANQALGLDGRGEAAAQWIA